MIEVLFIPQPVTITYTLCRLQKSDGKSQIVFILYGITSENGPSSNWINPCASSAVTGWTNWPTYFRFTESSGNGESNALVRNQWGDRRFRFYKSPNQHFEITSDSWLLSIKTIRGLRTRYWELLLQMLRTWRVPMLLNLYLLYIQVKL